MSRPVVSALTEAVNDSLEPFARLDEQTGWQMLKYIEAVAGSMLGEIHEIVRDGDDEPGWSKLFDPDEAPVRALQFLAQFAGVQLDPDQTEAEQRESIKKPEGFERGTVAALRLAVARTLTGSKAILIDERYTGSAYKLRVRTMEAETPSDALTIEAIKKHKPVGVVLTFESAVGQDWGDVVANNATWTTVTTNFGTWSDLIAEPPA